MTSRLLLLGGWLWVANASAAASDGVRAEQSTTSSGRLRIEVWATAVPLRHGLQTWSVRVVESASGRLAKGCRLTLQPWMPDMGHGVDDAPVLTERSTGRFSVEGLDLFMPGKWELRFQVNGCERSTSTLTVKLK